MKGALVCAGLSLLVISSCACPAAGEPAKHTVSPLATSESALATKLAALVAAPPLENSRVTALVVRQSDGALLYEHDADRAFIPASNMKVLTALAALSVLGPTFRFETEVLADRAPDRNGQIGTLYVRGGGDPALNSEDWWLLVASLRAQGLRSVVGDIVIDDRAFDGERWHPAWGRVGSRAYHAPVGALSANYGAFAVTIRPGTAAGTPVLAAIDPPVDYLVLENRALTVPAGRPQSLEVERSKGKDGVARIQVAGTLPLGAEDEVVWRSVEDPARYAGSVLAMQLAAQGIEWSGALRIAPVPEEAVAISVYEGRPLYEIVRLFMKHSNNAMAETLVKTIARADSAEPGSWQVGIARMKEELARLGVPLEGTSIIDGSGLSRKNRLSARTLVAALREGQRSFSVGPEFVAALPIAARDGTLEERAEESVDRLRAKTGLLNGAAALAGYARLRGSDEVAVFAIVANGPAVSSDRGRAALDAFAAALTSAP